MAIYSLYLPKSVTATPAMLADRGKIIVDRFSWFGFFLPVIALLQKKLWMRALFVFLLDVLIGVVTSFGHAPSGFAPTAHLCLMILVGLEFSSWRRAALERRGFQLIDIVEARDDNEALSRSMASMSEDHDEVNRPSAMAAPSHHGVIGLFPAPGSSR